jgi:A/G-specific adenine glycosylase
MPRATRRSADSTTAAAGPQLPADPALLRRALLDWYDRHRRRLPWRALPGLAADPYAVLVSEVMLQQTTVATVRPRFGAFMSRFPTPAALAAADLDAVLHAWQGLGYYRRGRALHACAQALVGRHGGRVPADPAALAALPGVGAYTAAAVAAIAFDRPVVPVDGNVERVLARLVALESPLPGARRTVTSQAEALAGGGRAGDLAQALMDLGAALCTPRRPLCLACPWRSWCVAAATGRSAELPLRAERATRPLRRGTAFLLLRPDGAMLLRRRPPTGLLGGMIDLPATPWETGAAPDYLAAHAPGPAAWCLLPGAVRHVFTHFALELRLARGLLDGAAPGGLWAQPADLAALALPTLARKVLAHAGVIAAAGRGA